MKKWAFGAVVAAAAFSTLEAAQLTHREHRRAAPTRAQIARAAAIRPLAFELNRGQVSSSVDFVARAAGATALLLPDRAVIGVTSPQRAVSGGRFVPEDPAHARRKVGVMTMRFAGARTDTHATATGRLPGVTVYPERGVHAPSYSHVRYPNVYRGIDLVYHGSQARLEHDWIVRPGADPGVIRLLLSGLQRVRLRPDGGLSLASGGVRFSASRPFAYQLRHGERVAVRARFVRLGARELSFAVGRYDRRHALVIDPVVKIGAFGGGSNLDAYFALAEQSYPQHFVFAGGSTLSLDVAKLGNGVFQPAQNFQAFVTRFDSTTLTPQVNAIFGSPTGSDGVDALTFGSNTLFGVGDVDRGDLQTKNAAQPVFGGGANDMTVFGMPSDLSEFNFLTFAGFSGDDVGTSAILGPGGNLFVSGYAGANNSPGFPGGTFQGDLRVYNPSGSLLHTTWVQLPGIAPATNPTGLFGLAPFGNNVLGFGGLVVNSTREVGLMTIFDSNGSLVNGAAYPQSELNSYFFRDGAFDPGTNEIIAFGQGPYPGGSYPGLTSTNGRPVFFTTYKATGNTVPTQFFSVTSVTVSVFPGYYGAGGFDYNGNLGGGAFTVDFTNSANVSTSTVNQGAVGGLLHKDPCPFAERRLAGAAIVTTVARGKVDCEVVSGFGYLGVTGVFTSASQVALTPTGDALVSGTAGPNSGLPGTYHGGPSDGFLLEETGLLPQQQPPCECKQVDVDVTSYSDFFGRPHPNFTQVKMNVKWTMTCSAGTGSSCDGRIEAEPPAGTDIKIDQPKQAIDCRGSCSPARALGVKGTFKLVAESKDSLDPDKRAGKTFHYHFKRICVIDGADHALPDKVIKVVYRTTGTLDAAKSDLNGNGVADGKEQKEKKKP